MDQAPALVSLLDLLTKLSVTGVLGAFIYGLLTNRFLTRAHHVEVVAQLTSQIVELKDDRDRWRGRSKEQDDRLDRALNVLESVKPAVR
jgi:hypothetical protein